LLFSKASDISCLTTGGQTSDANGRGGKEDLHDEVSSTDKRKKSVLCVGDFDGLLTLLPYPCLKSSKSQKSFR